VNLNWDPEQQELRATLRRYLARSGGAERRSLLASELGELGVFGLSLPAAQGGSEAGLITETVLFEELGYGLAGGLVHVMAALAVPLVCASATARGVASDLLAGRQTATVGWVDSAASFSLRSVGQRSNVAVDRSWTDGGTVTLNGTTGLVVGASEADLLVVITAGQCPNAYLVDRKATGVTIDARVALASSTPISDVTYRAASAIPLLEESTARQTIDRIVDNAILFAGAEAVGIAEAVLALATQHARTRTQFDRPIGSYQAVSHPLVNIYADLEIARSLGLLAAFEPGDSGRFRKAVLAGYAMLTSQLSTEACELAIQVHGGLGMSWESVLHHYYKRAKVLRVLLGPRTALIDAVANHLAQTE
jgi:alkylation response protein AidB-like acyl-CoA dehydrogenase